jgi:hypothetical protein
MDSLAEVHVVSPLVQLGIALDVVLHQELEDGLGDRTQEVALILLLQELDQGHAGLGHRGSLGPWLKSANSTIIGALDGHPGYTAVA